MNNPEGVTYDSPALPALGKQRKQAKSCKDDARRMRPEKERDVEHDERLVFE